MYDAVHLPLLVEETGGDDLSVDNALFGKQGQ